MIAGSRIPYVEAVRAYYNETWKDYRGVWMNTRNRALHFGYWDPSTRSHAESLLNMNRLLAERVALRPGERVLDAGCGVGGSAMWLAEEYEARVVGITLVEDQVRRARRYTAERGLDHLVTFEQRDYLSTELPEATFDVVWAEESLCHAPDKRPFFAEAYRLLRPGGRLVGEDLLRSRSRGSERDERLLDSWFKGWMMPNLLTNQQLVAAAREAGFESVALEDITAGVRRSLRRLHRVTVAFYPAVYVLYLLGFRSPVQHGNVQGARDQWRALRRGLWLVGLLTARRPET
jgi:tocopherol O-methyltransferase